MVLRFKYKNKDTILIVEDCLYTLGNIMTIIDIYFKETKLESLPSKLRLIVNNDNLDELVSLLNNSCYVELDKLGSYIESMKFYYKVTGYIEESERDKITSLLDIEPEEELLNWSDTIANESEDELENYMEDDSWKDIENLGVVNGEEFEDN